MKRRVDRSAHMDGRVGQTPHPRGAGSVGAGAHGGGLGRRWRRIGLPIPSDGRAAGTAWRRRRRHGIVLLLLILGLVGAAPFSATPAAADSTTAFTPVYPANTCPPPSYVVPAGVYLLRVVASGGAGQAGQDYNGLTSLDTHFGGRGGHGARVSAVLKVTPGETLYVDVAHSGNGNDSDTGHPNGGYAYDVTNGLQYIMNNGNAGGSSIVETNSSGNPCSFSRGDYLVVAGGGGGGGGADGFGGGGDGGDAGAAADGSGQNGGNGGGSSCEYGNSGGGGTATGAGGAGAGGCGGGGRGLNGVAGDGSQGGIAGGQAASEADNGAGGAGGGGWYGGGGGGNGSGGAGGGAGSSTVGSGVILESISATTLPPRVVFAPIPSPSASLYAVAAGNNFTCALTASQTVACWGDNAAGEATPPSGTFTSLSAGGSVVCGIKTDHTIACWGDTIYNQTQAPPGQFHQVSVGGDFVCGLRVDSTITCWGAGAQYFYQPGLYASISSGSDYYCALTYDQHPACQGNTAQVPSTTPAGDQFTQISSGLYAPCGIRTDGTSVCWGGSLAPTPIPAGPFSGLSSASYSGNMCWIGTDGTLQCATSPYGTFLPAPPTGAFSAVSMGYAHSCGVPATGGVVCWGDNSKGETTPLITGAFPNPNSSVPPPATPSQPYSFIFGTTYESPAATFSLTGGSLPPGLTLSPSGVLAGTPTAVGDYNFTISAGNGVAPVATLTTHLLAPAPPAITSANRVTLVAGSAGSFTVTTTGVPAAALSESGALPGGVTFTDNGDGTASLGGIPARGAGGSYPLTLTAHNGGLPDATQSFTLTVTNPLPATSGISPAAVQAGGGAVALTVSGANFVPGSRVRVTAAGRASATLIPSTVAPDGTQLTVTIPSSAITTAGVLQVAVLNAAPGGGASTLQPLFVTAAHAAVASESVSASGTVTTGGAGPNTTGSVTVGGSGGSGTVAVAIYAANPGGTPSFAASGGYFDAYVAPGSAFSSVRIVDCALQGGSQAYWYNAATASWIAASTQSYDPATQCTTITVNASSTPSLMQLGGTPFGIANVPPVVAVPGPQNAPYGRTLSFTVTASDIEPDDRVTLTASGLPAGLSIGPTTFNQATGQWTATVSGTVSALPGSYTASITANDGYSTSAARTVPVTVSYPPLYLASALSSSPAGPVTTGSVVTLTMTLGNHTATTQTESVKATLTYMGSQGSLKITTPFTVKLTAGQTSTKSVSFTITKSFPRGSYTLGATAMDGSGDTASSSVALTVS